jgi:alkylation response protein AidB-like acyl-CoA dehydrogenase
MDTRLQRDGRQGPQVRPSIEEFAEASLEWLQGKLSPKTDSEWGVGSDGVSVFHNLLFEEERGLVLRGAEWQREKYDAGYGAITWPTGFGGADLPFEYEWVFEKAAEGFVLPSGHEILTVTVHLVAPTIRDFGTEEQRHTYIPRFLRADELCCQLFSEPDAGSDLASIRTRARRHDGGWLINGQKVWSSGAQFADWGELIARTGADEPKHAGLTAFLLPMHTPGVEVRPIRQMSGGRSFNEVYFNDVFLPDSQRLGNEGDGWKVALATLKYERSHSGGGMGVGGSWARLLDLARWSGRTEDPVVRQKLAAIYAHERIRQWVLERADETRAQGGAPGPEGSIGKQLWVEGLMQIGLLAAELLGARFTADTGEWGTFAWTEHLLGAVGYRIAGGSDEIQRNIIAERVLGMPKG